MKKPLLILALVALASPAYALGIEVDGLKNGQRIPDQFAFCQADGNGKTKPAPNVSPQIRWKGEPKKIQSYALVVVDKDVPASFEDANQEGKTIASDFPRKDFHHWVLVDIPEGISLIRQGQDSGGHAEGGKPVGKTAYGINGANDYASFMSGTFGGYDGPCPPWNDERMHRYHFRIYALDVKSLGLPEKFTAADAMPLIEKHSLGMAEIVGTYSNVR